MLEARVRARDVALYPTTHMNHRSARITEAELAAAAALVTVVHQDDPGIPAAVRRATTMLLVTRWRVDGGVLKIESSKGGDTFYHADPDSCDCPAWKYCWHRAAWLLLSCIAAVKHEIPPMRGEPLTLMEAQALVDDLVS